VYIEILGFIYTTIRKITMADKEIINLLKSIEKNQKDLTTKYNVLVKRTNSIINSLSQINEKLNFLIETMSMFELSEDEEDYEDFDPYKTNVEDHEDSDEEDDE
jgi:hypothetical protein